MPGAVVTRAFCNNNSGQIIGRHDTDLQFSDSYGYVLTQGVFRTIAYPGAAITIAACANNNGEVVGGYLDSNGVSHGFLELPGERIPLADAELGVLPLTKEIRIAIADAETPNNGFAWLGLIS